VAASVKRAVTSFGGWIYTGAESREAFRLCEKGETEKNKDGVNCVFSMNINKDVRRDSLIFGLAVVSNVDIANPMAGCYLLLVAAETALLGGAGQIIFFLLYVFFLLFLGPRLGVS
jgi:hypothetical protein